MKIILIIIAIIVLIFVLIFLVGMISAAVVGRNKKRRAHAIVLLSQLPEELTKKLISILLAHKHNYAEEVNDITGTIGSVLLSQLLELIGPKNRPKEFSSGKFNDNLSWTVMEKTLQDQGYTINSSKIVAGIIFHKLDIVLMEINKKNKK